MQGGEWSPSMNDAKGERTRRTKSGKAALELMYIDEYLRERGYARKDLAMLSEGERTRLMAEATRFASFRLEELEARARLQEKIHNVHDPSGG